MVEEESTIGSILGLVFLGFVFWIMAPEINEVLPFDLRLFALLIWGVVVIVIVTAGIALVTRVLEVVGGR